MREIKFRFYSKKKGIMRNWDYVKVYNMAALEDNEDGESYSPWMQYTGLKDKNGKEIYEGDIVSLWGKHQFTVRWNQEELRYILPFDKDIEVIGNVFEDGDLLDSK